MISVHDLKLSLTTLGERLADEELDELIREVDQDGEGMVNYQGNHTGYGCYLAAFTAFHWWLGGVVVSVSDSRSRGPGFDSRPVHCQATTLGKLLTPMCLCHQAVQFGTGQRVVMLCAREGNRRSGVALAIRHRL